MLRSLALLLGLALAACQEITINARADGSAVAEANATVEQTRGGQTTDAINPSVDARDAELGALPGLGS